MPASASAQRKRWKTADGEALTEEVFACLVAGRDLGGLGLERESGRYDLRGITAPVPPRLARFEAAGYFAESLDTRLLTFRGVAFRDLDLSNSVLQHLRFFGVRIEECVFEGADCTDWRLWESAVSECDFRRAKLRNAALGTGKPPRANTWSAVDFRKADMRDTINQSTWYRACDFGEANLARVKFTQCSFDRCRFSGLLHEVLFDGRSFVDTPGTEVFCEVDFSEARFDDVMFMGLNLGDVPMPAEGNVRVLLRARGTIERALEMLKDDPSRNARVLEAVLEDELKAMQGEDYDIIWNSDDFGGLVGEQFNELAERVLGLSKRPGD